MKYFAIIFAFLTILLCGCSSSDCNIAHSNATIPVAGSDIRVTVLDETGSPYTDAPVSMTPTSAKTTKDSSLKTDINGIFTASNITPGEWIVMLYGSPKMTGSLSVIAEEQDYTVTINRAMVSGDISFRLTLIPEIEDYEPTVFLLPCGKELNGNSYLLQENNGLYYPYNDPDEAVSSIPAGSYYILYISELWDNNENPITYLSENFDISPETIFPKNVTLYKNDVPVDLDFIDENGDFFFGDYSFFARFEHQETGRVFYLPNIFGNRYMLPLAGTYIVSIPLFSTDTATITTNSEESQEVKLTSSKFNRSEISFKLFKEGTEIKTGDISLSDDATNIGLIYSGDRWTLESGAPIPAGLYRISGDHYSYSFAIGNGVKYPLTVELNMAL